VKKTIFLGAIFTCLIGACFAVLAQENPQAGETDSTVPALVAFHEIIYPIWHSAYPQKDYAALRGYVPEIKTEAEKIYAAPLPGILRDKEARWKEGVAQFKKSVDDYAAAAAGSSDEALLDAAEVLHARYEMLVRITKPVLREVDDFHKVLYIVYHKDLPAKNYDRIRSAAGELVLKAEAITKATLPARLESRKSQYASAAAALYQAAKELDKAAGTGDAGMVEAAVEKVHARYQDLVSVFE
jgi:hypothetical protein